MSRPHTILCPVDFSDASAHAVSYALELAKRLGASVHLVHVYELVPYSMPDGLGGADFLARFSDELEVELAKLAERAGPGVKTHLVVRGVPHREIARVAKDLGADLVVMGTHGRTGLERALLGSVADRVVRSSTIPVIVVPPAER
jgi:nucleotide-binding universal stress UspA family protein